MPNPTKPTNSTSYEDVLAELKELLPRNYIGGLVTSNDAGDADHDVNIAEGECRDVTDAASLRLVISGGLTKQIDTAWAVGDDAGGLDAGSVVSNQMYALWLIKRSDTGVVDAIFSILGLLEKVTTVSAATANDSYNDAVEDLSIFKPGQTIYIEGFTDGANNGLKTVVTSAANKITVAENLVDEVAGDIVTMTTQVTGPTMPADYDYRRLIAFILTDSAENVTAYTQSGGYFRYLSAGAGGGVQQDVVDNTMADGVWETGTLSVPPSCLAHVYGALVNTSETDDEGRLGVRTYGSIEDVALIQESFAGVRAGGITFDNVGGIGVVLVDASRRIEYACTETAGAAVVLIHTLGFTMLTRREP